MKKIDFINQSIFSNKATGMGLPVDSIGSCHSVPWPMADFLVERSMQINRAALPRCYPKMGFGPS